MYVHVHVHTCILSLNTCTYISYNCIYVRRYMWKNLDGILTWWPVLNVAVCPAISGGWDLVPHTPGHREDSGQY